MDTTLITRSRPARGSVLRVLACASLLAAVAAPSPASAATADRADSAVVATLRAAPGSSAQGMVHLRPARNRTQIQALVTGLRPRAAYRIVASRQSCSELRREPRRPLMKVVAEAVASAQGTARLEQFSLNNQLRAAPRTLALIGKGGDDRLTGVTCGPAVAAGEARRTSGGDLPLFTVNAGPRGQGGLFDLIHTYGDANRLVGIVVGLQPGTYRVGIGSFGCPASGKIVLARRSIVVGAEGVAVIDQRLGRRRGGVEYDPAVGVCVIKSPRDSASGGFTNGAEGDVASRR